MYIIPSTISNHKIQNFQVQDIYLIDKILLIFVVKNFITHLTINLYPYVFFNVPLKKASATYKKPTPGPHLALFLGLEKSCIK